MGEKRTVPEGMAGSHLNIAMERLGLRSQMRGNGPVVFDDLVNGSNSNGSGASSTNLTGYRAKVRSEKQALDRAIVEVIASGQWERLEANSGKSVAVGNHHVCVNFDEQMEVGYRTWEWHGHMLLYNDEEGHYKPEYAYGNYFEPLDRNVLNIGTNVGMERKLLSMLGRQEGRFN